MRDFIDLQRRFHDLTSADLEDIERLSVWEALGLEYGDGWQDLLEHKRVVILAEAGAGK